MTRKFDYSKLPPPLACNKIMNLLASVHECRGKQTLYVQAHADVLSHLLEVAKIQSADASNRIEGIHTSDDRLRALMAMRIKPRNRSEEEIAGYREALKLIHENYDHISLRPNIILQLHRNLCQFNPSAAGGKFKATDNIIAEIGQDGRDRIRFAPLSALETPDAMEQLALSFNKALSRGRIDPLLLIAQYILDFLCIHPFADGNGRMSRLVTLLLLYRSGYLVGKYISLERIIETTKESYYSTLEASSVGWREGKNNVLPFTAYFLETLLGAYREFEDRISLMINPRLSKPERIRSLFADTLKKLSKRDILDRFPDISVSTVEAALSMLLKEGFIIKQGAGKRTSYVKS